MREYEITSGNIPDSYVACVRRMLHAGHAWLAQHKGERPVFRVPPARVGFASDLLPAIHRLAGNDAAISFLTALEAAAPGKATAMQACIVVEIMNLLSTPWTAQEMADLIRIDRGGIS